MELDDLPGPLRPLVVTAWERVILPLKNASDEESWADTLDEVLEAWLRLRMAINATRVELDGESVLATVDEIAAQIDEIPLTLLPAPAHGAARYATSMLGGIARAVASAARRRSALDVERLQNLVETIAIIELAWFTLAGPERPRAAVAEAAAWEAYSRVRPLRALLARAGLDAAELPAEEPADAVERARAMLARVSRGWTEGVQAALESARLPADCLQP